MTDGMDVQRWPGERLGLPEHGPGAVAGWGRRLLALLLDWFGSMLVVGAVLGTNPWTADGGAQLAPLGVFAAQRWLLTSLAGGSFGQLATRIRVVRTDRSRLDPTRALLRTVLLCLVIPPVVYNRDQRGLHDLAAGSVAVRV